MYICSNLVIHPKNYFVCFEELRSPINKKFFIKEVFNELENNNFCCVFEWHFTFYQLFFKLTRSLTINLQNTDLGCWFGMSNVDVDVEVEKKTRKKRNEKCKSFTSRHRTCILHFFCSNFFSRDQRSSSKPLVSFETKRKTLENQSKLWQFDLIYFHRKIVHVGSLSSIVDNKTCK
jgi:hypothetical protein